MYTHQREERDAVDHYLNGFVDCFTVSVGRPLPVDDNPRMLNHNRLVLA